MKINKDTIEADLAVKAVEISKEEARIMNVPLYYAEDGYLVEELNHKKRKIKPIERNMLYGNK